MPSRLTTKAAATAIVPVPTGGSAAGGGHSGIGACDPRPDGGQRRPVLAVARPQQEARCEDEHRRRRAERNTHLLVDPATVRGEHEEQPDAERHDRAADDRETTSADEIPVSGERAQRAPRRLGRRRRLRWFRWSGGGGTPFGRRKNGADSEAPHRGGGRGWWR